METNETISEHNLPELQITENAKKQLKSTTTWTAFFAVLYFIGIVFLFLSGITMLISNSFLTGFFDTFSTEMGNVFSPMFIIMGILYIVIAVIMIFPALYLYRYSQKIKEALAQNDSLILENAIGNMKSYWRFTGILTIVYIALCIICIPAIIIAAIAMV
ncbi:MAG: DUF5362 domain-containing protein [Dysgonamonadaceae bacterium]|jgi:hypothetical protein|nr:DUF5362 domain-containing protein [Dysgonamonadaceae bacterium]